MTLHAWPQARRRRGKLKGKTDAFEPPRRQERKVEINRAGKEVILLDTAFSVCLVWKILAFLASWRLTALPNLFPKYFPAFKRANSFSQCPALFYQFSAGHILA
jgi:hypothetical protein